MNSFFQPLKAWIREDNWDKIDGGIKAPASRNDLMTVLADIDSILLRASHTENMKETRIRLLFSQFFFSKISYLGFYNFIITHKNFNKFQHFM